MNRENLGELVGEKVVLIAEVMNRQEQYLPKIPAESEVDLIFDTSYPDIQPYLFRVSFQSSFTFELAIANNFLFELSFPNIF